MHIIWYTYIWIVSECNQFVIILNISCVNLVQSESGLIFVFSFFYCVTNRSFFSTFMSFQPLGTLSKVHYEIDCNQRYYTIASQTVMDVPISLSFFFVAQIEVCLQLKVVLLGVM